MICEEEVYVDLVKIVPLPNPLAFYIEKRLREELHIPVMHDDQHGTAIISAAALLNALEIQKKRGEDRPKLKLKSSR